MLYKEYGKTGKKISVIGFGGMRFNKSGDDKYDIDKCAEVVRKANELGVNYFDTAPHYNDNQSEIIYGKAFEKMPQKYYVSTKSAEKDGDKFRKDLETSLNRLKVQKIDFLHLWCILDLDDYRSRRIKGGAYEAALKAKNEGLVEHIAFSTHCNGAEIDTIIREGCFEGVTLGYNILNFPYRQQGLKSAYEHGLGVATMNPLGGGFIPLNSRYFDFIKNENETVVEAALKFNCGHKEITTVLAGMGTIEEVIQNVAVGDKYEEFSQVKTQDIKCKLSGYLNELCTGCRYCEGCPVGLPTSKLMLAYNQRMLKDINEGLDFMKYHWHMSPQIAESCIKCGKCEKKCTQHLPIKNRLGEISNW